MAARIKKGDKVIILTGKDKGRTGEVVKSIPDENRVVVSGVNMIARHTRPSQADPQGGIKRREAAIHVSNVAHVDPRGIGDFETDQTVGVFRADEMKIDLCSCRVGSRGLGPGIGDIDIGFSGHGGRTRPSVIARRAGHDWGFGGRRCGCGLGAGGRQGQGALGVHG